ncbi:hypothetical protein TMatcc_008271 [Talaromyces marneffei ATCC 18224]|uniref:uncharacterized protein n=1 Tax=Talaromyces marneffei TaxID=37727 RepID=UPI0012A91124|nr:uncharacterized protein EYB26_007625 [Talaromyces marneffei]QGA19929.1 hypothetical protein EYB26_007625 [Talaromyces marneffei]
MRQPSLFNTWASEPWRTAYTLVKSINPCLPPSDDRPALICYPGVSVSVTRFTSRDALLGLIYQPITLPALGPGCATMSVLEPPLILCGLLVIRKNYKTAD